VISVKEMRSIASDDGRSMKPLKRGKQKVAAISKQRNRLCHMLEWQSKKSHLLSIVILEDEPIKVKAPPSEHEEPSDILIYKQVCISDSGSGDVDDVKGLKRNVA